MQNLLLEIGSVLLVPVTSIIAQIFITAKWSSTIKVMACRRMFVDVFNELKVISYRWGTPEWLEIRRELMDGGSEKSRPARNQRA